MQWNRAEGNEPGNEASSRIKNGTIPKHFVNKSFISSRAEEVDRYTSTSITRHHLASSVSYCSSEKGYYGTCASCLFQLLTWYRMRDNREVEEQK